MPDCECVAGCIFFHDKMGSMPATAGMMKNTYCRGDNSKCARYMVFKMCGRSSVPPDLFPNNVDRAKIIISSGKKA